MKIVIAIDSFKGCLTSSEANEAARLGVLDTYPDADVRTVAVSDGGEGWLDSILQTRGGEIFSESVHDPLMRTINADYLFLKESNTVVVESAKIIGLGLLKKEERNPLKATSYGLGEIIMSAWARHRGCRFIIGLGGTSTSDSGIKWMVNPDEVGTLLSYKSIMATFADPIIMLFIGGFVLAIAAAKTGLDTHLAKVLLKLSIEGLLK